MISEQEFLKASKEIGCEINVIKAVDSVESGGSGFLADGSGRLVMLFEPHIFWKELKKRKIDPAPWKVQFPYLLNPIWDPSLYHQGGKTVHEKFEIATTINRDAAYCSASYGRYQILGQNYKMVGFNTPEELVEFLKVSEDNHLEVFVRYVKAAGMTEEMKHKDWSGIAREYNGPSYTKNHYDSKLAIAYEKLRHMS